MPGVKCAVDALRLSWHFEWDTWGCSPRSQQLLLLISLLAGSFFLRFGRDSYFLLLYMSLKPLFLVTYSPPLSSCLLCKNPWIFSFFLSTFSVTFFPCLQGDPLPSNAWTVALLSQDMSGIKLSGTFICVTFICLGRSRGCLWQCSCSDSNAKRTALHLLKLCLFYSFDETARIGG